MTRERCVKSDDDGAQYLSELWGGAHTRGMNCVLPRFSLTNNFSSSSKFSHFRGCKWDFSSHHNISHRQARVEAKWKAISYDGVVILGKKMLLFFTLIFRSFFDGSVSRFLSLSLFHSCSARTLFTFLLLCLAIFFLFSLFSSRAKKNVFLFTHSLLLLISLQITHIFRSFHLQN